MVEARTISIKNGQNRLFQAVLQGETMMNELWPHRVLATDPASTRKRISEVCGSPPCRLERPGIFLLGPVTGDGLRATHLSRESARYRVLPACATKQAVSHGIPRQSLALDFGRREQIPRLAYLRRFCPGVDCDRPPLARL